jgi:cytoskeletal protein CcmA (bactofilin family)
MQMGPTRRLFVLALGLACLLGLLTMGIVLAQGGQLGGKLLTGSDVTIPAGETVDHDIYVFGGSLTSNGTINGDVVAAGGNLNVNGPVSGDVLAAAGTVHLNGPVSGDVRTAGGQITISGDVAEDVLVAGGQVALGGHVGQDLIVASGQLNLTGSVAGSAVGSAGTYSKTGSIGGTDSITVTGNQAAPFVPPPSNLVLDAIRQFITVLVVALLALWLVPRGFAAAEAQVRTRPVPSLGWGIGAVIGYFVLVIAITLIVILLAIILGLLGFGALLGIDLFGGFVAIAGVSLGFIVAGAFVADAIVGLALARWLAGRTSRSATFPGAASSAGRDPWRDLGLLAVGVAIVVVVTSLPILGPWVKLVVVLLGLGSLWLAWRRSRATAPGTLPDAPPWPPAPSSGWR